MSGNIAEMPITLLIFAAVAIVSVLVFSTMYDALPTLSGTANTTVVAFAGNFYSGVGLLGVGLIVLGAVTIISIVYLLRQRA